MGRGNLATFFRRGGELHLSGEEKNIHMLHFSMEGVNHLLHFPRGRGLCSPPPPLLTRKMFCWNSSETRSYQCYITDDILRFLLWFWRLIYLCQMFYFHANYLWSFLRDSLLCLLTSHGVLWEDNVYWSVICWPFLPRSDPSSQSLYTDHRVVYYFCWWCGFMGVIG